MGGGDGEPMEEVASGAGYPYRCSHVFYEDLPEDLQPRLLSANPGEVLDPIEREGRYELCRLVGKTESIWPMMKCDIVSKRRSWSGNLPNWPRASCDGFCRRSAPHDATQNEVLDRSSFFRFLPEERADCLRAVLLEEHFEFGEVIVREGEEADACYILVNGRARVVKEIKEGQEIALAVLRPGDQFGEQALIGGGRRNATVRSSCGGGSQAEPGGLPGFID